MKRIITILLVLTALTSSAYAESTYMFTEYGASSYADDFEGADDEKIKSYPYFISGKGAVKTGAGMNGGKGIVLDTAQMNENETEAVLFSFHPQSGTARPEKESYYFEIFVKGFDKAPANITPCYTYSSESSGGRTAAVADCGSEPAQDGWIKLWYRVPVLSDYSIDGHAGWRYRKAAGDPGEITFDNFAMRPVPSELIIQNRSCASDGSFDLSELSVTGINSRGEEHVIKNKQMIKWRVLSGDAQTENGRLIPKTSEPQTVCIEGDFFGAAGTAEISFYEYKGEYIIGGDDGVTASIAKTENAFTAEIMNNGQNQTAYFMTAVYVNGRLYKVNTKRIELESGKSCTVNCGIPPVPKMINGEISARAYVWTGAFGAGNCAKAE